MVDPVVLLTIYSSKGCYSTQPRFRVNSEFCLFRTVFIQNYVYSELGSFEILFIQSLVHSEFVYSTYNGFVRYYHHQEFCRSMLYLATPRRSVAGCRLSRSDVFSNTKHKSSTCRNSQSFPVDAPNCREASKTRVLL